MQYLNKTTNLIYQLIIFGFVIILFYSLFYFSGSMPLNLKGWKRHVLTPSNNSIFMPEKVLNSKYEISTLYGNLIYNSYESIDKNSVYQISIASLSQRILDNFATQDLFEIQNIFIAQNGFKLLKNNTAKWMGKDSFYGEWEKKGTTKVTKSIIAQNKIFLITVTSVANFPINKKTLTKFFNSLKII